MRLWVLERDLYAVARVELKYKKVETARMNVGGIFGDDWGSGGCKTTTARYAGFE